MQNRFKAKTCCFTGHRTIPPTILPGLSAELEATLLTLIQKGFCYFGAGGALGFDTLCAETVLRFKTKFPHIRLILVLPCRNQTNGWSLDQIQHYNRILCRADKVVYTADNYFPGCMHLRNRHLVDYSSVCVAYCTRTTGRTTYAKYESGELNIRASVIIELRKFYGCAYDAFFEGLDSNDEA